MTYELHPACSIWPKMTDEELSALAEDIRARGLIHPVTLYNGKLLDGKNRERACEIAGVKLSTVVYEGDDPVGHSISLNKTRRHLSKAELSFIAEELASWKHGGDRTSGSKTFEKVLRHVAGQIGIGKSNVESAHAVKKYGEPNVLEMVRSGKVGVQAAGSFARHTPREEQRTATVEDIKRNGNVYKRGLKSMGDRVRTFNETTGFKIMGITVRKAKPIGRMPDDTRQKIESHLAEIKARQFKLETLLEYADQMSEPLRHLLADELRDLRGKFDKLARLALGEGVKLRTIDRPLCNVEIPLRKDESGADLPGDVDAGHGDEPVEARGAHRA